MNSAGIKYSVPLRGIWERFRDWEKRMHSHDKDAFYRLVSRYSQTQPTLETQRAVMLELNFWRQDSQGKFLHVWFEQKELYDFLLNEVDLKELDGIKRYLADNGDKLKEKDLYDPSIEYDYVRHDIALHVPLLECGFAFSFCLMPDNTVTVFFADDDGVGQIHESEYYIAKSGKDESSIGAERNFRFAVNLLAYMECFPECVRDGVPIANDETEYLPKGRNVKLCVSKEIAEEIEQKGTKRPHKRKGYFKRLMSDFYKNKRGQIIFVRGSMVNSKSKTVDMSDDEKKIDEFKHV